jgi:hypothetical protein
MNNLKGKNKVDKEVKDARDKSKGSMLSLVIQVIVLVALLSWLFTRDAEAADAIPPGFIQIGTEVKPINPTTGQVDHSKPYYKVSPTGDLVFVNRFGRRPGTGGDYRVIKKGITRQGVVSPKKELKPKVINDRYRRP